MITPIWRDTFYEADASASPFTYGITMDGVPVFNGKAWAAPAASAVSVNINRIAEDYLHTDFPNLDAVESAGTLVVTHSAAKGLFSVVDSTNTVVSSYTFFNCWDYDTPSQVSFSDYDLSKAINRHGTDGMYYFKTVINGSAVTTTASTSPLDGYSEAYCGDYALYYLSRSCGWSSYLIEGNVKRYDEYTRYSITKDYDNNTINRGKTVYNNQISPRWEVNTGWVRDSESDALAFHLLSSNQVYLHDINNGKVYPVVITDTQTEYKNRKNQSNKVVNYTISLSAAQIEQNLG